MIYHYQTNKINLICHKSQPVLNWGYTKLSKNWTRYKTFSWGFCDEHFCQIRQSSGGQIFNAHMINIFTACVRSTTEGNIFSLSVCSPGGMGGEIPLLVLAGAGRRVGVGVVWYPGQVLVGEGDGVGCFIINKMSVSSYDENTLAADLPTYFFT